MGARITAGFDLSFLALQFRTWWEIMATTADEKTSFRRGSTPPDVRGPAAVRYSARPGAPGLAGWKARYERACLLGEKIKGEGSSRGTRSGLVAAVVSGARGCWPRPWFAAGNRARIATVGPTCGFVKTPG